MSYPKLTPIIAKGATEPRYLEDRFTDEVNVRDYGAKGDGITDDTSAIQTAVSKGGKVIFPFGTYLVTESIEIPENTIVDGCGSTIVANGVAVFKVFGEQTLSEVPISGSLDTGDDEIATAASHGLNVGDLALLWSQRDSLSEAAGWYRLGYHQGLKCYFAEPVWIKEVVSDSDVKLTKGIIFPGYKDNNSEDTGSGRTTTTIAKLNLKENVTIQNFSFNITGECSVIFIVFAKDVSVKNINIKTNEDPIIGVSVGYSYGVDICGMRMETPKDMDVTVDTERMWKWLGVGIGSSWFVNVHDCYFVHLPCSVDITFTGDKWNSMFCSVKNCTIEGGTINGFTTHPGVWTYEFHGNKIYNCNEGMTVRGRRASIIGNTVQNNKYNTTDVGNVGIHLFASAKESIVSNNTIKGYHYCISEQLTVSNVAMLGERHNIFTNNYLSNADRGFAFWGVEGDTDINGCLVANNIVRTLEYCIDIKNNRHGFRVVNNEFHVGSGSEAIRIRKDSTRHLIHSNAISGNMYLVDFDKIETYTASLNRYNNIVLGYDYQLSSGTYLNGGTNNKPTKRFDHLIVGNNGQESSKLLDLSWIFSLVVDAVGGGTIALATSGETGYPGYTFIDGNGNILGSVGYNVGSKFLHLSNGDLSWALNRSGHIYPGTDNAQSLGKGDNRLANIYAASGVINTSDERDKSNIKNLSDDILRAWGKVGFKIFQFNEALESKGEEARLHVGVVAQDVSKAFASEGLDVSRYGLFCYDEWEAAQEERNNDGKIVVQESKAGNRFGIRYEEALALECAYQRWRIEQLEERINQLINNINK